MHDLNTLTHWEVFVEIGGVKLLVAIAVTLILLRMVTRMNNEPDHD